MSFLGKTSEKMLRVISITLLEINYQQMVLITFPECFLSCQAKYGTGYGGKRKSFQITA
jgi:hypothetical protein